MHASMQVHMCRSGFHRGGGIDIAFLLNKLFPSVETVNNLCLLVHKIHLSSAYFDFK